MELEYRQDWEQVKERYKAWWAHEYFGRCAIAVYAPRDDVPDEQPPRLPENIEGRWLDFDYLRAANDYHMRRTFYGGEAFPIWNAGYPGWGCHACFLGAEVRLAEDTGWIDPVIYDGDLTDYDYRDMTIAPDNRWWVTAQEMLRFAARESCGRSIPSIGAIGGCGDTLASLRGTDKLLLDVLDCPDYVREFEEYLMKQWFEMYNTFYGIIQEAAEGSTCWFPIWSPGKFYPTHNDFSYMISPLMFREIFLPVIEMQTDYLDHSVYHVDGIGAFAHVDALCELPNLQALQILPGTGKPSPLHFMDVLKKVQARGKNLHITIPAHEVEAALSELSARGLMIETYCGSQEEASALLKNVEKWSKDR